jgi:hypothetical protein
MSKHLDSTGAEMTQREFDRPFAPLQTFAERMGFEQPVAVEAGPLSDEHRKILSEPDAIDRREFDDAMRFGEFSKAFAVTESSSPLHKAKSRDFQEADAVLREFTTHHDKKTLHEQLAPLVDRACAKLSKEHGELLRKAHAALDLSILSFFLGRAFA